MTAFEQYYRELFAPDEYDQLIESLIEVRPPVLYIPPQFYDVVKAMWLRQGLSWEPLAWFPAAVTWPVEVPFGAMLPGVKEHALYPLAASSILPVLSLKPEPEDEVLDACAAPGGKSLLIAGYLRRSSQLWVNDISPERHQRLQQVMLDFDLKPRSLQKPAERLYLYHKAVFDKVLLDAPCSSEVHVYRSPSHMDQWTKLRIERLQHRQLHLIHTLSRTLKPGGVLVYSTCAITPEENEVVVSRTVEVLSEDLQLIPGQFDGLPGEAGWAHYCSFPPEYVRRILPHRHHLDPMFVAVFKKRGHK